MQADEIREMTDDDLASRIDELERERFNLRFRAGTQTLEDPLRLRVIRKDMARMRTIQQERVQGIERKTPSPARKGRKSGTSKAKAAKSGTTGRGARTRRAGR